MSAAELLAECQARDIDLLAHDGQLDIDAPAGALTDELLQRLRDAKPELLVILATPATTDPDLTASLATLTPADLAYYHARLSSRHDAGEPDPGIEWQAMVDVQVDRGHWTTAPAPRPRSAVPVAVEWPAAAGDFCLLLTPDDLPPVPFKRNAWTEVRDAVKFLRSLRGDIAAGPSGPRAFYGALQADLENLQRFVLAAHE